MGSLSSTLISRSMKNMQARDFKDKRILNNFYFYDLAENSLGSS